jgi:micrococcal nuclease
MFIYNAKVVNVVDADTLDVEFDLGFSIKFKERVRLVGVNAPERFTDAGRLATEFVKSWLPANVTVATYKNDYDKYGRYLASIINPETQENLSTALIKNGHGVEYLGS